MSSHREAPEISLDPVADSTDVYAFVSPDNTDTVTLIANYIPLQNPAGGPMFYEFGDEVTYEIHISNGKNKKKSDSDITYQFRFFKQLRSDKTFLYNVGPINSLDDKNWIRPQFYNVARIKNGKKKMIAKRLACPPVNVGPRSTPDYAKLAKQAVHQVGNHKFFAGQRADAFHVDLGSIFDLGALRPFNEAHLIPLAAMDGINTVQPFNVHSIAIQIPITELTRNGKDAKKVGSNKSVIGVWTSAKRQKARIFNDKQAKFQPSGSWEQVSRLANPLVNEVLIPMAEKDEWNHTVPRFDGRFAKYVNKPELAALLPVLYPGVFPNLAKYGKDRADLNAILMTGIPEGIIPGFQNFTSTREADLLRLNMAIGPSKKPNNLGVVGGDLAGFPNGRRIDDDVVTIELRAIAGLTLPLVDPSFKPDDAASAVTDGTSPNTNLLKEFPYLGQPGSGYDYKPGKVKAS